VLDDQNHLLTQFLTLWARLDPISHLLLFLGATGDLSRLERRRAAVLAVLFAFLILTFFGVAGQYLLDAMGISLIPFRSPAASSCCCSPPRWCWGIRRR